MNLTNGSYALYNKPGNTPAYVHSKSNHPPTIIRNIPTSINKRLSNISSNARTFSKATAIYQQALRNSEYEHSLQYTRTNSINNHTAMKRKRNITWYNPPFNKGVATNIGRQFLKIVDNVFTADHPLRKIFNRNTIKVSYSTMPNIQQIINKHNTGLMKSNHQPPTDTGCNCRDKNQCPLPEKCKTSSLIYQATVTSENEENIVIHRPNRRYIQDQIQQSQNNFYQRREKKLNCLKQIHLVT